MTFSYLSTLAPPVTVTPLLLVWIVRIAEQTYCARRHTQHQLFSVFRGDLVGNCRLPPLALVWIIEHTQSCVILLPDRDSTVVCVLALQSHVLPSYCGVYQLRVRVTCSDN